MLSLSLILRRKDENVISGCRPLWVFVMFGCHHSFEAVHPAPSYSWRILSPFSEVHMVGTPVRVAGCLTVVQQPAQGLLHRIWVQSYGVARTFNACDLTLCSHKETRIFLSFPLCRTWHLLKELPSLWGVVNIFSAHSPTWQFLLISQQCETFEESWC